MVRGEDGYGPKRMFVLSLELVRRLKRRLSSATFSQERLSPLLEKSSVAWFDSGRVYAERDIWSPEGQTQWASSKPAAFPVLFALLRPLFAPFFPGPIFKNW